MKAWFQFLDFKLNLKYKFIYILELRGFLFLEFLQLNNIFIDLKFGDFEKI
jgi:hypothetical protein